MTHTHDDRVAERPSHLCAAYGCPMIGIMSASTRGDGFMCRFHAGKNPGELDAITVEINRLSWLAAAARDVRIHKPGTTASRAAFELIEHELHQHQRDDLRWNRQETGVEWMGRLEAELNRLVLENLPKPPMQTPLAVQLQHSSGAVLDMPA